MDTTAMKTGFTYDPSSEKHYCEWDPLHSEGPHRTKAIMKRLEDREDGLIADCQKIKARFATPAEILSVHSKKLMDDVNHMCAESPGPNWKNLKLFSEKYNDTYISNASDECALLAAGQTVSLVTEVWKGTLKNGLALVRPPGHHASPDESNGFCIFNNVAIAAQQLMDGHGARRILIVDWDVHHGQGTQRKFYSDKRVFYFSIHRYENGDFWPNLRESNFDYIGEGAGVGYNVNVPLNKTGLGDAEYMAILHQVLLPLAYEFNPEIVIVSAGYDAAMGCPEGRMNVSPALYGHYTHALGNLAGGKVAVILEGGYCVESLSEGVACTLEALLGRPLIPLPPMAQPDPSAVESILNVISVLRDHWKCLNFQTRAPARGPLRKGLKVHTPEVVYIGPEEAPPNEAYCCTAYYPPGKVVEIRHEIADLARGYGLFRENRPSSRTCYAYDSMMTLHSNDDGREITIWDTPERLTCICNHLKRCGLLEKCHHVKTVMPDQSAFDSFHGSAYAKVLATADGDAFLRTVRYHTEQTTDNSDRWAPDLFASRDSITAIRCAVGSLQSVADEVLSGRSLNGFAIVRPPGHHAHADHPAGFCFANNVGIVAKTLLEKRGVKRILIVDWDIHHGDGVQEAFYEDPRVLYVSLHRGASTKDKKENDFYPEGKQKSVKYTGDGAGVGFNINLPWSAAGKSDGDYVAAFLQLVMPVAYEFAPEMTLVCCGFDGAEGDKGDCHLSPRAFYLMTRMLKALAGGRLVLSLEGGYRRDMLEQCSESVFRGLLDLPLERQSGYDLSPSPGAIKDIKACLETHDRFWPCLQYCRILDSPVVDPSLVPPECPANRPPIHAKEPILSDGHSPDAPSQSLSRLHITP